VCVCVCVRVRECVAVREWAHGRLCVCACECVCVCGVRCALIYPQNQREFDENLSVLWTFSALFAEF